MQIRIRIRYLGYIALASLVGWVGCGWLWLTLALLRLSTKDTRTHTRHWPTHRRRSFVYILDIYIYI